MALLDDLRLEDLPNESLRFVAEVAGLDTVRALMRHCAGLRIEIPKNPNRRAAKRYIEMHYNGKNASILACKLGISTPQVFVLLREKSAMRPTSQI